MIYFINRYDEVIGGGHVGGGEFDKATIAQVAEVQADGSELAEACAILGRTLPPRLVFRFYGDDARTIAGNWR